MTVFLNKIWTNHFVYILIKFRSVYPFYWFSDIFQKIADFLVQVFFGARDYLANFYLFKFNNRNTEKGVKYIQS